MKFSVEDRVRLNTRKRYADGTKIAKCSKGTIDRVYPIGGSYLVRFDSVPKARRILEKYLDPA